MAVLVTVVGLAGGVLGLILAFGALAGEGRIKTSDRAADWIAKFASTISGVLNGDLAALGDWVYRRQGDGTRALPDPELRAADPRAWRAELLARYRLADGAPWAYGDGTLPGLCRPLRGALG